MNKLIPLALSILFVLLGAAEVLLVGAPQLLVLIALFAPLAGSLFCGLFFATR